VLAQCWQRCGCDVITSLVACRLVLCVGKREPAYVSGRSCWTYCSASTPEAL
jgi:hypothetical protein